MKYGLKDKTIDSMQTVFSIYPEVEKAILYGSRAKGNFKPASDIDITLVGDLLNLDILNKIEWKLDDLLLPYAIDLSIFHYIKNEDLMEHVKKEGMVIYEKITEQNQVR